MQSTALKAVVAVSVCVLAIRPTPSFGKEPLSIVFSASPGQTITWRNGAQIVTEVADRSHLELSSIPEPLPDKQTAFRVSIVPSAELTFGPEDVWIEYGKGKRALMLSYEELAGRLRRDVKRRKAVAALGAAMAAGSANGYTTGHVSFDGTTSEGERISGSGTYSAYDPLKARQEENQAAAQARAAEREIEAHRLQGEKALKGMLRRTTVKPLEPVSGIVAFDPPRDLQRASEVTIIVRIGEQEHRTKAVFRKP